MGRCKVGAPHPRVLPILCTALLLLSHAATSFRLLDSKTYLQPFHHDGRQESRFLRPFRLLAETEEAGEEAEDSAPLSLKHKELGSGINRLGIHGEGLKVAHALLESDAEVMALAAAMKSGQAIAEGRGNDKADSPAGDGEEGEAGSPAGESAPRKPGRLQRAEEKLVEAARAADGAADGADQEAASAEAEEPDQAAAAPEQAADTVAAAEKEKSAAAAAAAEAAESLPPWFSRKTAAAGSEAAHRHTEQSHGAGRHSSRRSRHHNSVEDTWLLCHQRYLKETAEVDKHGGWDVLFYGDSIIEEWRGTFLGAPWGPFYDVRKVWDEFFGRKPYTAHSMGIASDGVEQLAWRLQHGELPTDKAHQPKVLVLHVGTNDIVGECTNELGTKVAEGIKGILSDLHNRLPSTHLVIMALLPKGEVWPNRCSGAIDTANEALQNLALSEGDHLHYIDVGQAFLSESLEKNKFEIKEALMPDSMHPSAVGMRIIATRLEPLISQLVSTPLQTGPEDQRR
ncbi:probable platelet-activating factor acetylhydrolase IB subunit beta at C-terminar half [Coccomyxa sp. Obi]|nr:probable platelet-activating factor acetylhydrolase IB subunit beta at C-terminar half [Coccomyxa sp. Obi]